MTLSASNPFLASTRWRAIVRALGAISGSVGYVSAVYGTRVRCKNKTSREFLRKPGQNVFGNAYNAATNASENFLVSAGTPASLAAFALAFAGTPASLAAFALAFADTPASLAAFALAFAGTPASLAANARAFAGVPQERFSPFWRLQDCCKHFQRHFGRYNMLSETFSMNKGISFFCRTHVMDSIGTLA